MTKACSPRQRNRRFAHHEALWREIRRLKRFTVAELSQAARVPRTPAKNFATGLAKAGVLAAEEPAAEPGQFAAWTYQLVRDLGRRCPRVRNGAIDPKPTAQERIWAAMKPLRGGFTIDEVAALARAKYSVTCVFLRALAQAGYLAAPDSRGTYETIRYRLVAGKHTGPEPPRLLRDGAVYDVNLDRIVWSPQAEAAPQAEEHAA